MRRDAEPLEAGFAGGDGAAPAGVVGQHLGDDEGLLAAAGDGLAHHFLGAAAAVHLGGVDQRHAEIEAEAEGRRLVGAAERSPSPIFQVPWPSAGTLVPSGNAMLAIMMPPVRRRAAGAGNCRSTAR